MKDVDRGHAHTSGCCWGCKQSTEKMGGKKKRCAFLLLSSFRTMVWLFVEDFFKVFLDFVPFTSDSVIRAEPGQRVVPFSLHVHRMHTSHGVSVK